jgi:hypothetical protein
MKRMSTMRRTVGLALAAFLLGAGTLWAIDLENLQKAYEKATRDYQAKSYEAYLEDINEALRYFPNHPILLFRQAAAYSLTGKPLKALLPLRQTAAMGLVFNIWQDPDFRALQKRPEMQHILDAYARNAQPLKGSRPVFSYPGKALLIEGVAFDPKDNRFYLGSVRRGEILRLDRTGKGGPLSRPEDGLWGVMGLKVDPARRRLWAAVSAVPQLAGFKAEDAGRAGLACYDLKTGRLLKKYVLPGKPETHLLGDLTVDGQGTVLATDSQSPLIYSLDPSADAPEVFLKYDPFQSLQGIDLTPDGKTIYVADYSVGLYAVDRATRTVRYLEAPRGTALIGIDGLYYYQGSLIAVQNGLKPNRVLRVFLSRDGSRIGSVAALEANEPTMTEPTLGCVVGDLFYFNANAQWDLVDDKGRAAPSDKWKDPVIRVIDLKAPPAKPKPAPKAKR